MRDKCSDLSTMKIIPIRFEHHGREYNARFTHTPPDTTVWYLTDNKGTYLGKLRRHNDSWIFDDTDPGLNDTI